MTTPKKGKSLQDKLQAQRAWAVRAHERQRQVRGDEVKMVRKTDEDEWTILPDSTRQTILALVKAPPADAKAGEDRADKKVGTEEPEKPTVKLGALLAGAGKGSRGFYGRFTMHAGSILSTNTSNAKYAFYFVWSATPYLNVSTVASNPEWSSFNSVFDEFFVHSMAITYEPYNEIGGALPDSATANNRQSSMMTAAAFHLDQAVASDNATGYAVICNNSQHLITNSARRWKFVWRNITKFEKSGQASTATSSQGWMNVSNSSTYGGAVQVMGPDPTGAAIGIGTWATSINLGACIIEWDVSFRYRS